MWQKETQLVLNFIQFDLLSVELDLEVLTANKDKRTVGSIVHNVTGLVEAATLAE